MAEQVMAEQVMAEQVMAEQVMAEQVMGERRVAGVVLWVRRLLAAVGACVMVVLAPQSAWAAGGDVLGPLLGPVAGSLKVALLGVGGVAIGIYVTVWAMQKAWGLFKGLVDDPMVRGMTWNYDGKHPGGAMNERGGGGGAVDGFYGDPMQGHTMADYGDTDDSGWSQSQEYEDEMNATGPDHLDYEADAAEKNAAAISYLDRYR
jgi:hypothetical protein